MRSMKARGSIPPLTGFYVGNGLTRERIIAEAPLRTISILKARIKAAVIASLAKFENRIDVQSSEWIKFQQSIFDHLKKAEMGKLNEKFEFSIKTGKILLIIGINGTVSAKFVRKRQLKK